jgi:addiction module HigA family antidote
MSKRDFPPIHPGEILVAEFLEPLGVSQYRLAKDISVTPRRINEIVHGRRGITADTALRLGRYFNMEAQFWLNSAGSPGGQAGQGSAAALPGELIPAQPLT